MIQSRKTSTTRMIIWALWWPMVFMLVGCRAFVPTPQPTPTLAPEEQDQSWLTDQPCQAPCWYGLEPGMSFEADVLRVVQELSFISPEGRELTDLGLYSQHTREEVPGKSLTYPCASDQQTECLGFNFFDDTLNGIFFYPNYALTLEDIVSQMGPPSHFRYSLINPEGKSCEFELIWEDRQMYTRVEKIHHRWWERGLCSLIYNEGGRLPPQIEVDYMTIFQRTEIEGFLSYQDHRFRPWVGLIGE